MFQFKFNLLFFSGLKIFRIWDLCFSLFIYNIHGPENRD